MRCRYCPHPNLKRPKEDMDRQTFHRSIEWAVSLKSQEISFTGMGEALLHPDFPVMMFYARAKLPGARFLLATNGLALVKGEEQHIKAITRALHACNIDVYISAHRPEVAGPALEILQMAGVKIGLNGAFIDSGFDWAGQVEWHGNPAPRTVCKYIQDGWGTILVDGSIVNCCMDAHGLYPIGHVNNKPEQINIEPIPLCEKCHLIPPKEEK